MRKVDLIIGSLGLAVGAFSTWQSARFTFFDGIPGPGFLPMTLSVSILVLSVLLLATRLVGDPERFGAMVLPAPSELRRVGSVFGILVVGAFLMPVLGFVPAMAILIGGLLFGVERMRSIAAIVTTLVVPFGLWWVFDALLGVRLPEGPLGI